jgi:hypothetical protein
VSYKFNPFTGTLDDVGPNNGNGVPGGSNTEVQFNDGGVFGGDVDFTYNKTSNLLTIGGDINLNDGGTYTTTLQVVTPTANRTISFPDATGTVALVAGASSQVTYNSAGVNAGDSGLLYDATTGKLTVGTKTVTTDNPVLDLTQTWNAGGVAFNGINLNITNTASAAGAALLNLRIGGTSQFAIGSAGQIVPVGNAQEQRNAANAQTYRLYNTFTSSTSFERANLTWSSNVFIIGPERGSAGGSVREMSLRGALAVGTNIAGGQVTIQGGQGTGTGLGGSVVFQTAPAGSSGSTANAVVERFRIDPNGVLSRNQAAPVAVDATATVTIANLQVGILTSDAAVLTPVTITLPTGTDMDGGFASPYDNQTFEWSVINVDGVENVTIAGNGAGHTLVGNATVAASTSARWASRRTAATTWVSYRIT